MRNVGNAGVGEGEERASAFETVWAEIHWWIMRLLITVTGLR